MMLDPDVQQLGLNNLGRGSSKCKGCQEQDLCLKKETPVCVWNTVKKRKNAKRWTQEKVYEEILIENRREKETLNPWKLFNRAGRGTFQERLMSQWEEMKGCVVRQKVMNKDVESLLLSPRRTQQTVIRISHKRTTRKQIVSCVLECSLLEDRDPDLPPHSNWIQVWVFWHNYFIVVVCPSLSRSVIPGCLTFYDINNY